MSERMQHLEVIFPDLATAGYSAKSPKSPVYNCIAYAAGDETRKWEGFRELGYHWPPNAKEGHLLDALISAFEQLGYSICESDSMEPGFDKVGLYSDADGLWTHAARQLTDGRWASKLGNLEDIVHATLFALAGPEPAYGNVSCIMKRPTEWNQAGVGLLAG